MTQRVDVLILGGGVLGSSIAWSLASGGVTDVCVVDVDLAYRRAAAVHAWPLRTRWDQELNVECGLASREFLRTHGLLEGPSHGHIWLADDASKLEGQLAWSDRHPGSAEVLAAAELGKQFPLLERAAQMELTALWVKSDGVVDPVAVRSWFRERAAALGVQFLEGAFVEALSSSRRDPGRRRVEAVELGCLSVPQAAATAGQVIHALTAHALHRSLRCEPRVIRPGIVINALGAWSGLLRTRLGGEAVCRPCPRPLAVLSLIGHEGRGLGSDWPGLVVDPAGTFFFADSAYTLAGLDVRPRGFGFDFSYSGKRFFEDALWPHLAAQSDVFERVHHLRGTVFLEACTPDRSGVLGPMPGYSNVFEAFGFPGSGLSHAFAIARGLAEWIIDGRYETLDLAPLTAGRFALARELPETFGF